MSNSELQKKQTKRLKEFEEWLSKHLEDNLQRSLSKNIPSYYSSTFENKLVICWANYLNDTYWSWRHTIAPLVSNDPYNPIDCHKIASITEAVVMSLLPFHGDDETSVFNINAEFAFFISLSILGEENDWETLPIDKKFRFSHWNWLSAFRPDSASNILANSKAWYGFEKFSNCALIRHKS